jgi:hypothetical protein
MRSWFDNTWAYLLSLLSSIDFKSALSIVGQKLVEGLIQAVAVVVIGWLVLYRQWRRLVQGKSDQVVFSANLLTPLRNPDGNLAGNQRYVLQIRTVLPSKTIDELLDNVAVRRLTRRLAEHASIEDPILATRETAGFEIINDVVNYVAGGLAASPYHRESWLLAVTCEDRKVVRKCCIRVLLVRRSDIEHLASWEWCRTNLVVEEWYHYWRIVTLHQIALRYQGEQANRECDRAGDIAENRLPLVDQQAHHPRIRTLSLGINVDEAIIKPPVELDWERYALIVARWGLKLSGEPAKPQAG